MKKMVLSLMIVLMFVSSVSAQTKKFSLSDENIQSQWQLVNSKAENAWKIGTVVLDPNDPRSLILSATKESDTPCLVNTVPGNWTQLNPRPGVDIYTKEKFGDCTVKIELFLTKGSNSGVYLHGEYEVQVADSFGKPDDKLGQGDMGAIYSAAAPKTNATAEPGTWQKYEIEFVAPKFDANGNKTANALFKKITLNGKVVQENIEAKAPTGGGITMKEAATGPLMLQGNHGPVAYRNIEISQP
ncbi:MAG: DUF1080 domain-containing protein [Planctomycetaceae bacterium]|jgi:hypothetical protein|nr:DUF1080 domain-containing protein [Planctomycetaceae bacterium]